MKKVCAVLGGIAAVLALVWLCGRYGWRLFGFAACDGSGIELVTVTEDSVTVKGFDPGSFPAGCVGVVTKQEGDVFYLGVRYDAVFGFFETGSFSVTVPIEAPVSEVILCAGDNRYPIWSARME